MQFLRPARPPRQQRPARQPVRPRMRGGDAKVEAEAPVREVGEVAKGLAGRAAVRAVPAQVDERRDEGVGREEGAVREEGAGREQP